MTDPDQDDVPTQEEEKDTPQEDAAEDENTRHAYNMRQLMKDQQRLLMGLHHYSSVIHKHMHRAAKGNGPLPPWFRSMSRQLQGFAGGGAGGGTAS